MDDCWNETILSSLASDIARTVRTGVISANQERLINGCRVQVSTHLCSDYASGHSLYTTLLSDTSASHSPLLEYFEENYEFRTEKSEKSWKEKWISLAERQKIAYAVVDKFWVVSTHFVKLRIVPHLLPYLAIIVFDDVISIVSQSIDTDFLPMETFLRFHHSHIDYDSQALPLLSLQLGSLFSQMTSLRLDVTASLHGMHCNNALWLLFDPIRAALRIETENQPLEHYTEMWVRRQLSNYDYIEVLNKFVGRTRGQVHNHPIYPWVCDFSSENGGWRKMNRTKYRLNKGDDQLREMFSRAPAHHIPELLSDIGYMVYRARVESREDLCKHVRSKWVPLEYPVSMARMYEWTPDECIPEFYDSPEILVSSHCDMPSLELPPFVAGPKEFIRWHRAMLESDEVSEELHKWIDLTFGYLLSGDDAERSLNVHLSLVEQDYRNLRRHGVVQLFDRPHPRRSTNATDSLYTELLLATENKNSMVEDTRLNSNDDDCNSLTAVYKKLCRQRDSLADLDPRRSVLLLISQIGLSHKGNGRFQRRDARKVLREHGYALPRGFLDLLTSHLLSADPLPSTSLFPLHLITSLNIPFDMVAAHDELSTFYSCQLLRHSPVVRNHDKREQSLLIRELSSLRLFIQYTISLEFITVAVFERLLRDPVAAITAVHRLVSVLCRTLSDESLAKLVVPLTALLGCESSIKLLDRRFLLPVSIAFGAPLFLLRFVPSVVEAAANRQHDRSIVAKQSLLWLSKRYGPVVCARFVSSNLLRILSSCYQGMALTGKIQEPQAVFSLQLEGDLSGCQVESALAEIAASYSVTFVTVQYLPFCVDVVDQCFRRMTSSMEAGLLAALRIAMLATNAMTDSQLMIYLEDYLVDKVLVRIVEQCLSAQAGFSSTRCRLILLCRSIQVLYQIAIRIGAENTRKHAKKPFIMLFEAFSRQFGADEDLQITNKPSSEFEGDFPVPQWVVSDLIDRFSSEWGVPLLSSLCPDPAFLVPFVSSRALCGSPSVSSAPMTSFGLGCFPSGNRLSTLSSSSPSPGSIGGVGVCDAGSLSELWCARVSAAASNGRPSYRFDHMSLCSFEGHSAAIRCSAALSNENSFISGSADKTIKLWSMRPEQDRVDAQLTYRNHHRSINDVLAVDGNSIVSTDGSIHVWDPFRGSIVCQLDWTEGNISQLARVDRSVVAAISSLHPTIRLLDTRCAGWSCELKASAMPGLAKAIAVRESGARMAVALSNGTIVVMDARTGKLASLSHGNNTHTTAMRWLSSSELLVCDADETAAIFSSHPRLSPVRRLSDAVTACSVSSAVVTSSEGIPLVSTIQTHGILRVYSGADVVLETRLKPECLPGSPSSIVHLPLNNAYLIGTTNGTLKLMC